MAVKVVRGEDVTLSLTVRKPNGDPFDLTGSTEIMVEFQAESGCVEKTLTGGEVTIQSAALGRILVTLTDADTNLLVVGRNQPVQVNITKGTITRKALFLRQLEVIDNAVNCDLV